MVQGQSAAGGRAERRLAQIIAETSLYPRPAYRRRSAEPPRSVHERRRGGGRHPAAGGRKYWRGGGRYSLAPIDAARRRAKHRRRASLPAQRRRHDRYARLGQRFLILSRLLRTSRFNWLAHPTG